jgi:hypothetical protein
LHSFLYAEAQSFSIGRRKSHFAEAHSNAVKMGGAGLDEDNIIHRMAMDDPVPWYKKPNLRAMYLLLFPCVIGIEMTSGFDSQIINSAQMLPHWKTCVSIHLLLWKAETDMKLNGRFWQSHRRLQWHSCVSSAAWVRHWSAIHPSCQRHGMFSLNSSHYSS